MRLAHIADLHLDTPFALFNPTLARRRRQGIRAALTTALEGAAERSVDAVLVAGDLFEQDRVAPDTASFLREAFRSIAPIPVYVAPGNHDWLGPESIYRHPDWPENVHLFGSDTLERRELADGVYLWGAAHDGPAITKNFLFGWRAEGSGIHLGLFHGAEQSVLFGQPEDKAPYGPFHAEQVEEAGLTHLFTGHLHTPVDGAHYTYPGNPEPLTFGEAGEPVRGLVIATLAQDGGVTRERVSVAQTQVADCDVDLTGCAHSDQIVATVRERLDGMSGFVRLTLHGDVAPEVDFSSVDLRHAIDWLDDLVVRRGDLGILYDFETLREEPTVRGQFVKDVLASHLDDHERRAVLITGLRAFEGRPDLEVA
jgi:DNA repair exonuclease SbcCD nuclease subunit